MADSKLTALGAGTPALASLLYGVDDPGGTPVSVKYTITQLLALLQGGLTAVAGGADADQAMAVNTMYVVDISGYTADRTYTLPTTAAAGDRIGILLSQGDTAFELLITAAASDMLNGVAGGTEWSRLLIQGECVIMRCVTANSAWIVEVDGRIPQQATMRLSTNAAAETAGTNTQPTSKSGVWTADVDNASLCTTASDRIIARRGGRFAVTVVGRPVSAIADGNYFVATLTKNGTAQATGIGGIVWSPVVGGTSSLVVPGASNFTLVADDYLVFIYASQAGSRGLLSSAAPELSTAFTLSEIL